MTRSRMSLIAVILLVVIGGGIAAGLLLTRSDSSSSNSKPRYVYPQSAIDDIRTSCEKRLKAKTCLCVVAAYQSTMPYTTFQQVASLGPSQATITTVQKFQAKSAACPR